MLLAKEALSNEAVSNIQFGQGCLESQSFNVHRQITYSIQIHGTVCLVYSQ